MPTPEPNQLPTIVTSADDHSQTIVHLRSSDQSEIRVWVHGPLLDVLEYDDRRWTRSGEVDVNGQATPHYQENGTA